MSSRFAFAHSSIRAIAHALDIHVHLSLPCGIDFHYLYSFGPGTFVLAYRVAHTVTCSLS